MLMINFNGNHARRDKYQKEMEQATHAAAWQATRNAWQVTRDA
jgi:hypothetical protein